MIRIRSAAQSYAWGSPTAIPELLGVPATGDPVAGAWFGSHHAGPSLIADDDARTLVDAIAGDPRRALGEDVVARFGERLVGAGTDARGPAGGGLPRAYGLQRRIGRVGGFGGAGRPGLPGLRPHPAPRPRPRSRAPGRSRR